MATALATHELDANDMVIKPRTKNNTTGKLNNFATVKLVCPTRNTEIDAVWKTGENQEVEDEEDLIEFDPKNPSEYFLANGFIKLNTKTIPPLDCDNLKSEGHYPHDSKREFFRLGLNKAECTTSEAIVNLLTTVDDYMSGDEIGAILFQNLGEHDEVSYTPCVNTFENTGSDLPPLDMIKLKMFMRNDKANPGVRFIGTSFFNCDDPENPVKTEFANMTEVAAVIGKGSWFRAIVAINHVWILSEAGTSKVKGKTVKRIINKYGLTQYMKRVEFTTKSNEGSNNDYSFDRTNSKRKTLAKLAPKKPTKPVEEDEDFDDAPKKATPKKVTPTKPAPKKKVVPEPVEEEEAEDEEEAEEEEQEEVEDEETEEEEEEVVVPPPKKKVLPVKKTVRKQ